MKNAHSSNVGPPRTFDDTNLHEVAVNEGNSVLYAEYGIETGVPLLFLHGTPGSHLLGGLFDEGARRYGIRLLAPARPGYAHSSPWPGRTLSDTGEFVTAVLNDAGISRASVAGFSGGGPHALAFAATHEDRVREVYVVSGVAPPSLRETTPKLLRLLELLARTTPRLLGGLFRAQQWLAERASPSFVVSQYTTPEGREELPAEVAELLKLDFVEAFANRPHGAVLESRLLANEWDFNLDQIARPVRLWHGGRDANVPVEGPRRICERVPNGRMTVFDSEDHLTTLLRSQCLVLEQAASNDS